VLPPLKKGASTNKSTGLAAHLPASTLASRLTDEVLPPLKEGVITHKSSCLSSVIVPTKISASIQQSTIPTFATTDATKQPTKCEDDSFIRDIPSNLIYHVSKKGGMKSPVSNHRDKFRIKRLTDHCCDGVSISSSGSHRLKRGSEYLSATKGLQEIPKTQNQKACRLCLQYFNSDAGTVETQPPERDLNAREAPRVTPTKRPPNAYMEDADSDLTSDNDSKSPAKNAYSKRPARKKPIAMTCAAKVSRPAERHQEVDDESSGDGFLADADDPDYVDEDPSIAKEVRGGLSRPQCHRC
jgi:hypothetical protein